MNDRPAAAKAKSALGLLSILLALLVAGCGKDAATDSKTGRTAGEQDAKAVWARYSPAVLRIHATSAQGNEMQGSGFIVSIGGRKVVLTNRHVVQGAAEVKVGPSEKQLVKAPSYRISTDADLAWVELPKELTSLLALEVATKASVSPGSRVFVIGFPLGFERSISEGIVNSVANDGFVFNASISSGSSGGPVMDPSGRVLGIATLGSNSSADGTVAQNFNVAVWMPTPELLAKFEEPLTTFLDAWRKLATYENELIRGLQECDYFKVRDSIHRAVEHVRRFSPEDLARSDKERRQLVAELATRHGSYDAAVRKAVAFLRQQTLQMDRIPDWFMGFSPQDGLFRQFATQRPDKNRDDAIPTPEGFVEGLRLSLEHNKAHFEDSAFYIEFFHRHLNEVTNGLSPVSVTLRDYYGFEDAEFSRVLRTISERVKAGLNPLAVSAEPSKRWRQISRKAIRIHYPDTLWSEPIDKQVELLVLSMERYEPPATIMERLHQKQLSPEDSLRHFGGLAYELIKLFTSLAIYALEQGDVNSAISLEATDTRHRDAGDRLLLAYLNACAGNQIEAYGQTADAWSSGRNSGNNAMSLINFGDVMFSRHAINLTVSHENDMVEMRFGTLKLRPTQLANLDLWQQWCETQGSLPMAVAGGPIDVIPSKAFDDMSEFEQARLLWRYDERGNKDFLRREARLLGLHEPSSKDASLRDNLKRALELSEKARSVAEKLGIRP